LKKKNKYEKIFAIVRHYRDAAEQLKKIIQDLTALPHTTQVYLKVFEIKKLN